MKKLFTSEEFIESYPYSFDKEVKLKLNKWCDELFKQNFIDKLLRKNNNIIINYTDILNLNDMSLEEKFSWLYRCLELTQKEQQELALKLNLIIEPIYNKRYPKDNTISTCNEARRLFIDGKINADEFLLKRDAALDVYFDIVERNSVANSKWKAYNGFYSADIKYCDEFSYIAWGTACEPDRASIYASLAAAIYDKKHKTNYKKQLLKDTKKYLSEIK